MRGRVGHVHISAGRDRHATRFTEGSIRGAGDPPDPFAGGVELADDVALALGDQQIAVGVVDGDGADVAFFFFGTGERALRRAGALQPAFQRARGRELEHFAALAVRHEHRSRAVAHRDAVGFFHVPLRQHADERSFFGFRGTRRMRRKRIHHALTEFAVFPVHDVHVAGRGAGGVVHRDARDFAEAAPGNGRSRPLRKQRVAARAVWLVHQHGVFVRVGDIHQAAGFRDRHARRLQFSAAELRQESARRAEHVHDAGAGIAHEHIPRDVVHGDRARFAKRRADRRFAQAREELMTHGRRRHRGRNKHEHHADQRTHQHPGRTNNWDEPPHLGSHQPHQISQAA